MNAALAIVLAVCFVGATAIPMSGWIEPMIGGGATPPTVATDALHAVMLMAFDKKDDKFGRFGGGSIVSRDRIITTAALVAEAEIVRIWFYITNLESTNLRQARQQEWIQPNARFVAATLLNDIAVVTFKADVFPVLNVIKLANAKTENDAKGTVLGYGFSTPDSTKGERVPLASEHTVIACPATQGAAATHICTKATTHVVCPGDQGSGLYTGTGINRRLIGIVSNITAGCTTAGTSSFTDLFNTTILAFLRSQGLTALPDTTAT